MQWPKVSAMNSISLCCVLWEVTLHLEPVSLPANVRLTAQWLWIASNSHSSNRNYLFCYQEQVPTTNCTSFWQTYTRLVDDIKKLSPDAQTSCLGGFHSTLNHWHPKIVCFSWLGTFCRYRLWTLMQLTNACRNSLGFNVECNRNNMPSVWTDFQIKRWKVLDM